MEVVRNHEMPELRFEPVWNQIRPPTKKVIVGQRKHQGAEFQLLGCDAWIKPKIPNHRHPAEWREIPDFLSFV
jgi:hypothetical protein